MPTASSRAPGRATTPTDRLAEFHAAVGHAGSADGCQDCQAQQQRQRQTAAALRGHQRQARQQVDGILTSRITVADLHRGDTVLFEGQRHNVVAAIRERDGSFTLQLQIPGTPVRTFHQSDPGFVFTRILGASR